ncbi:MAG TPA: hypothetical protein VNK43_03870 [Gemmatimonadales bacterium]|nr:hypothetical protein [Gemmatimonadales bacterium]
MLSPGRVGRLALALLGAIPARPVRGQDVDVHAALGATYATSLVEDRIFEDIEVRQAIAPTLFLGAGLPIGPRYRVGAEAALATGSYDAKAESGSTDLGTVRTAAITLGLTGTVVDRLHWRVGVGLLKYFPADETGIFRRGGPAPLLAGVGAEYRLPWRRGWQFVALARYDVHRFTTDELEARGFPRSRSIHRVALGLGLTRVH